MNHSKSGQTEGGTVLVDLLIVVGVLIVLTIIGTMIYHVLAPGSDELTSTKNNFENLVKALKDGPEGVPQEIPLYIHRDYFIIGFNKGQEMHNNYYSCPFSPQFIIRRPMACANTCICLCSKKATEECKNAECHSFESGEWTGSQECKIALVSGTGKPDTYIVKRGKTAMQVMLKPKQ
jgi:hypothetical protein